MLARVWRLTVLGWVAVAVLWALYWGGRGHWIVAIGGALVLLGVHAWVLAVEFVVMALKNRHDPVPAARWHEVLRAWWAETVICAKVFGWRQAFCEHRLADEPRVPGRRGIVFIHGYLCNRALWLPWFERLLAQGVPYTSVSLAPMFESIDSYAAQVEAAVQRLERATGLAPVLVCHSMGGLVARAWLRWQASLDRASPGRGDARAHHVITIGTPHRGTWTASAASTPNGRQMRLDSAWLRDLERSETLERRSRFTCFYSHCDNIVFPTSVAVLPDAQAHHVRACAHMEMVYENVVFETALRWVGADAVNTPALQAGPAA